MQKKQSQDNENKCIHDYVSAILTEELSEQRMYKFAWKVDVQYLESFTAHYSEFSFIPDSVICPDQERAMYVQFRDTFPTCHALFSFIV